MIWFAAAAMIIVALLVLLWPLWRSGTVSTAVLDSNTANVAVLKQQLEELEQDYASGVLSEEQYDAAVEDLRLAVASDLDDDSATSRTLGTAGRRWTSLIVLMLLPLASILFYQQIHTYRDVPTSHARAASAPAVAQGDSQQKQPSIEEMAEVLAARLRQDPENQTGWKMLGKTYAILQRVTDAIGAYEKAYQLGGDEDVELLVDYAEVLAAANENRMQGRPIELVTRALEISPGMPKARWLAGFASFQLEDYATAVQHWESILNDPEMTPESSTVLDQYISEARKLGGLGDSSEAASSLQAARTQLVVHVSLGAGMAGNVKPDDTVFVFVRLPQGMPMPLAARKIKVADLPASVVLDESMAMMDGHSLAGKDKVVIGARVSRGGGPIPQPGDIQGLTGTVSLKEAAEFMVTIDQIVK